MSDPGRTTPHSVAKVVSRFTSAGEDIEMIEIHGHRIQYGEGSGGGGFCYSHQSFTCVDKLTPEEREAINRAV